MGRRNTQFVRLSEAERAQLESWARGRNTAQALADRARIVLAAAGGGGRAELARELGVSVQTISKWRSRFGEFGLPGLLDAARSGAPKRIDEAAVSTVIARTLEKAPAGATHWTTRLMARELGMSQSAISRIWRGCGLQPRHQESFSLAGDPDFLARLQDVVGVYLDPPTKVLALILGTSGNGVAPAAFRPAGAAGARGLLRGKLGPLMPGLEWTAARLPRRPRSVRPLLQFLRMVDSRAPAGMTVQLMLNNAEVYKLPSVLRWFLKHTRFRLRFTPSAAAWRQQAEEVIAILAQARPPGRRNSVAALERAIANSPEWSPQDAQTFIWVRPDRDRTPD